MDHSETFLLSELFVGALLYAKNYGGWLVGFLSLGTLGFLGIRDLEVLGLWLDNFKSFQPVRKLFDLILMA